MPENHARASPSLCAAQQTGLGWHPPFGAYPLRPGFCVRGAGGPPAALRLGDPGRAGVCVRGAPPTPELGERNNKELIYPAGPLPCLGSSRTFSEGQRCFLGRNAGALSVCLEAAPRIRARLLRLRTLRRQMQTPRPAAPRRPKLPARDPTRDQRKHGATGLCVPQRAEATNGSPAEPAGARAAARPTRPEQGAHAGAHSHEAGKKRAGRPALPDGCSVSQWWAGKGIRGQEIRKPRVAASKYEGKKRESSGMFTWSRTCFQPHRSGGPPA